MMSFNAIAPIDSSKQEQEFKFKMYIDYDKSECVYFHNFFFEDYNFVLKIGMTPPITADNATEDCLDDNLRLERFDLTKYVYLLYYD